MNTVYTLTVVEDEDVQHDVNHGLHECFAPSGVFDSHRAAEQAALDMTNADRADTRRFLEEDNQPTDGLDDLTLEDVTWELRPQRTARVSAGDGSRWYVIARYGRKWPGVV